MVQSDRVRHNWSDFVHTHIHTYTSQNQELPEVASVFPILSITKLRLRPILLYEIRKCAWCDSIYSNYDFKNAYFSQMPYSYFSIHTCEIRKTKFHSAFVSQRESTLHLFWRESTLHSDWEIQQRLKSIYHAWESDSYLFDGFNCLTVLLFHVYIIEILKAVFTWEKTQFLK